MQKTLRRETALLHIQRSSAPSAHRRQRLAGSEWKRARPCDIQPTQTAFMQIYAIFGDITKNNTEADTSYRSIRFGVFPRVPS